MTRPIVVPPSSETEERFWLDVDVGAIGECWRWRGRFSDYGAFTIGKVDLLAHRVAWAFAYGVDPGEMLVLHSCDVAACVNPRHLRLGTVEDNGKDQGVLRYVNGVLRRAARPRRMRGMRLNEMVARKINATRPVVERDLIGKVKLAYAASKDVPSVSREFGIDTRLAFDIITGRAVPSVCR